MKTFNVDSKDFSNMLTKLIAVVPKKAALPIISYALFEVDSKEALLKCRATDLEIQIESKCTIALPDSDFKFLLQPTEINQMVKMFPRQPLTIGYEDSTIIIMVENKTYKFPTIPDIDDFPLSLDDKKKDARTFEIKSEAFLGYFEKALNTVGSDELRPVLNGVSVRDDDGDVDIISSDAHFLSYYKTDLEMPGIEFIIPKTIKPIIKILSIGEDVVLEVSQNYVSITGDDKIIFRTIEGKFPNAKSIIPNFHDVAVIATLDVSEFKSAIQRLSLVAENSYIKFSMKNGDDKAVLETYNIDKSKSGNETISVIQCENRIKEDFAFGVSPTKMIQLMNNFTFSEVNIFFYEASKAIVFKPANVNNDDTLLLLMPMMLNN